MVQAFFFLESCESEKNFRTTPDLQNESTRCQADPPTTTKAFNKFFWGKTSQLMLMKLFEMFEKMQRMCNASPGRISNLKPRPGTVHSSRSMKPCQMVLSVLKMRVHGVFTVRVY